MTQAVERKPLTYEQLQERYRNLLRKNGNRKTTLRQMNRSMVLMSLENRRLAGVAKIAVRDRDRVCLENEQLKTELADVSVRLQRAGVPG